MPSLLIKLLLKELGDEGLPGCWLEAILFATRMDSKIFQAKFEIGEDLSQRALALWPLKEQFDLKLPTLHFYKHKITDAYFKKIMVCRFKRT